MRQWQNCGNCCPSKRMVSCRLREWTQLIGVSGEKLKNDGSQFICSARTLYANVISVIWVFMWRRPEEDKWRTRRRRKENRLIPITQWQEWQGQRDREWADPEETADTEIKVTMEKNENESRVLSLWSRINLLTQLLFSPFLLLTLCASTIFSPCSVLNLLLFAKGEEEQAVRDAHVRQSAVQRTRTRM